jgi:microcin C transport system permease protein
MVPTFIGVTLVVFLLTQFVPGGPIDQAIQQITQGAQQGGETGGPSSRTGQTLISEKDLEALKEYYGFNLPVHERYLSYMKNLLFLDLGKSFRYSVPTAEMIAKRLPISLYYGLITTILTYAVCIPLGIVKAIRHRTLLDNATSVIIFAGYAIPPFALGAVLITIFAANYDWFPLGGFNSSNWEELSTWGKIWDIVHHSVLPLICYMIGSFALMTLLMKNSLMENMSADYVKTALANGSTWRKAIFGHAVRNSLIPLATSFGNIISLLLAGSLLIESVFNIQGMGLLFYEGIQARDYPVVMGITVISAILLLVGNLLSDLCVAAVDPRVRFQ